MIFCSVGGTSPSLSLSSSDQPFSISSFLSTPTGITSCLVKQIQVVLVKVFYLQVIMWARARDEKRAGDKVWVINEEYVTATVAICVQNLEGGLGIRPAVGLAPACFFPGTSRCI